jgi:hypothetical protein
VVDTLGGLYLFFGAEIDLASHVRLGRHRSVWMSPLYMQTVETIASAAPASSTVNEEETLQSRCILACLVACSTRRLQNSGSFNFLRSRSYKYVQLQQRTAAVREHAEVH